MFLCPNFLLAGGRAISVKFYIQVISLACLLSSSRIKIKNHWSRTCRCMADVRCRNPMLEGSRALSIQKARACLTSNRWSMHSRGVDGGGKNDGKIIG